MIHGGRGRRGRGGGGGGGDDVVGMGWRFVKARSGGRGEQSSQCLTVVVIEVVHHEEVEATVALAFGRGERPRSESTIAMAERHQRRTARDDKGRERRQPQGAVQVDQFERLHRHRQGNFHRLGHDGKRDEGARRS